jgi:DNA-binding response OmpR family regulator
VHYTITMKKILVVDDNTEIQELVAIILMAEVYEVDLLSIGDRVANSIRLFKPDLIILDIMMGELDGRVICKTLKSDPKTMAIPVILFSASHEIATAADVSKADDFIAKPFDIDVLASKVKRLISLSKDCKN